MAVTACLNTACPSSIRRRCRRCSSPSMVIGLGPTGRYRQQIGLPAVQCQERVDDPGLVASLRERRPRPVSEQDTRGAIRHIEHTRQDLRSHEHDPVRSAGPGSGNRRSTVRTRSPRMPRSGRTMDRTSPGVLGRRRRWRDRSLRRAGGDDEKIDRFPPDPGPPGAPAAASAVRLAVDSSGPAKRRSLIPVRPGSTGPRCRRSMEVGVRHDPVGQGRAHPAIRANRPDVIRLPRSGLRRLGESSNHTSGCPGWTGSPSWTSIPATLASMGLFTSTAMAPCSTRTTACPRDTHSYPSWNREGGGA